MDLVVYDEQDRRYVPAAVAVALVVLAAVLAAAIALAAARRAQPETISGASAPQPAVVPTIEPEPSPDPERSPEPGPTRSGAATGDASSCTEQTLMRADAVLERSRRLEEALAAHTRIMEALLAEELTAPEVLDRTLPVLTQGASDRTRFADEAAAYERSRRACTS